MKQLHAALSVKLVPFPTLAARTQTRYDASMQPNPWIYKQSLNASVASDFSGGVANDADGGVLFGVNFTTVRLHQKAALAVSHLASRGPTAKKLYPLRAQLEFNKPCLPQARLDDLSNSLVLSVSRALGTHSLAAVSDSCEDLSAPSSAPSGSIATFVIDSARPCTPAARKLGAAMDSNLHALTCISAQSVGAANCHTNADSNTATYTYAVTFESDCPPDSTLDGFAAAAAKDVGAALGHAAAARFTLCSARAEPAAMARSRWTLDLALPAHSLAQARQVADALHTSRIARLLCSCPLNTSDAAHE